MLRPSAPTLRDARNRKQSLDLFSISSVNSKYVANRQIVRRSFDDPDLISSADRALNNDAEVCPGSQRLGETAHKPLIVHPNSKPPARDPRLGYFKHGSADRPMFTNERIVHRDSFRGQIFPKLTVLQRSAEFLFPPSQIFHGASVDNFIGTPVRFAIRLIVSFEIDSTNGDTTVDVCFPHRAFGRSNVIIILALS